MAARVRCCTRHALEMARREKEIHHIMPPIAPSRPDLHGSERRTQRALELCEEIPEGSAGVRILSTQVEAREALVALKEVCPFVVDNEALVDYRIHCVAARAWEPTPR